MAVAAAELAGAGEGAAAGTAGELSPEASSAVRAAAAGHGKKLSAGVKRELRARASSSANKTVDVVHHYAVSGGTLQAATATGAGLADSASRTAGVRTPAGKTIVRLFVALIAFVIALEIGSYLTGRYFNWNLGGPAKQVTPPVPYQGLYKGQAVGGQK